MSNLTNWAINQVERIELSEDKKGQYKAILDAFSEQGHSGSSAEYTISFLRMYVADGSEAVKAKLNGLLGNSKDSETNGMQNLITKDIVEIIDLLDLYGFESDDLTRIVRLMHWLPIVPLTGADEEWGEIQPWSEDRKTQQNKVCSAVFRDNLDNSTAHWVDGRVYSDNGGHTWFATGGIGNNGEIRSSVSVEFPFWVPDGPEYIYLNGEDSDEIITDKNRIKELYDVWERKWEEDNEKM